MNSDTVPPAEPAPVTDFVSANRTPVAAVYGLIGVVSVAVGGYYLTKLAGTTAPGANGGEPTVIADPNRLEHFAAGVLCLLAAFVGFGFGAIILGRAATTDRDAERRAVRGTLLLSGGLFGLILMAAGAGFFCLWFDSLTDWLNAGKRSEAKWVLGPVLVFLLGAGLTFVSAQPARAEERNDPGLRRMVYGTNFALTAVLFLLLLLVGNVAIALTVPNKLDTTQSGFYTLSDSTRELLVGLDQPVTAYSTIFELSDPLSERLIHDTNTLLAACRDANPAKFQVRLLDPRLNRDEINQLQKKYPQFDKEDLGILLVAGEDQSRATFIRTSDLFSQEFDGGKPQFVFLGESKLVRELLFLTESKTKPTVYFTQGSGEMEIAPPAPGAVRAAGTKSLTRVRELLEKNYAEVKPLAFDAAAAKVPDDATVVVVADPQRPLPPEAVAALKKYMTDPRPDGKKGKMIVLTSPHPKPDGTGVAGTGLEPLLSEFGVRIGNEYIVNEPLEGVSGLDALAAPGASLADARNPVALSIQSMLVMPDCREVVPAGPAEVGPYKADALLVTLPRRGTWLDADPPIDPVREWADLRKTPELRVSRKLTGSPRGLAVLVSDTAAPTGPNQRGGAAGSGRVAVYGSGSYFADPDRAAGRQAQSAAPAELLAATVDWLRDRPAAANVATKTYGRYTPKPNMDLTRALLIPVGLTALAVIGLGVGVAVVRRT